MPLTEELDIEVETLDSTEGLTARGIADDRLAEMAAAVRIACAGAIARPTRTGAAVVGVTRQSSALRIAALALLGLIVAIVAWLVVSRLMAPKPEPPHVSVGAAPPQRSPAPVATPARPDAAPPAAEPPSPTPTAGRVVQPRPPTPVIPPKAPAAPRQHAAPVVEGSSCRYSPRGASEGPAAHRQHDSGLADQAVRHDRRTDRRDRRQSRTADHRRDRTPFRGFSRAFRRPHPCRAGRTPGCRGSRHSLTRVRPASGCLNWCSGRVRVVRGQRPPFRAVAPEASPSTCAEKSVIVCSRPA